jgi:hypothetical protein
VFERQVERWGEVCQLGGHELKVIGLSQGEGDTDRTELREVLSGCPESRERELWVVLVGHGTYDGKEARFNLRGPDLAPADLVEWLKPHLGRVVVLNAASSSAPFLNALSGTNRVVLTATRSGFEQNLARFGGKFTDALLDPQADLDKDDQVSLLEAFVVASHRVGEFYSNEGRLATEHALIDDTGDGKGTPSDWFRGVRLVKRSEDGTLPDGLRAHQIHLIPSAAELAMPPEVRVRRDALELDLARLRERKELMSETAYLAKLEELLLEMAALYQEADARMGVSEE